MRVLLVGKNSFLAQNALNVHGWHGISHSEIDQASQLFEQAECLINFACEPCVWEGKEGTLDHDLAERTKRLGIPYITMSSRAVYGDSKFEFKETDPLHPGDNLYAQAKARMEQNLMDHFDHVTILRPSNVFGFEYFPDKLRRTFFAIMLKSLAEQEEIAFNMAAETQKDFIPVAHFSSIIGTIANRPEPGIFNVGSGIGTSVGAIANAVIQGFGSGKLAIKDNNIKGAFTLDMSKTHQVYDLKEINRSRIIDSCIDIGQELSRYIQRNG